MKLKLIRANKTKFGGAEVYLSRLSSELKNLDIDHELIYSSIPKFLPSWLRVILFNLKICFKKDNNLYFSLERISCPDIYRAGDGVHKRFLEIEKKSIFNPLHAVYLFIEKRTFNNSKKIIAISNMVKNDIINAYDIKPDKIRVIYNGFKLEKSNYELSFNNLKKEFNLDNNSNEKIFLYVGSGFKRKGVKEFLEILSKLKNKNFKAFVVGKEKKIKYYKDYVKELNIENKVIFTGPRTDVKDFYSISDIFLFPTRYEPFGNVIIEAMNFENVVITTKFCGGGEILNQDLIMNNSTDYSIVEKIDNLLINDDKIEKLKKENLKIVQNFSIERNVQETLEVINEVIN
ncbi:glycosyltransferase family 4 protein [Poseidonibacter lekithochrous]|uniref:glycosyltransferase family 4 protein n=1 Tax=Poseidonibacter lekithochrous TaxID=1904463 RepID=UPI000D3BC7CC|nr:glycosyltransferase family 4 protein [Poseidonibacter lekithochrous]